MAFSSQIRLAVLDNPKYFNSLYIVLLFSTGMTFPSTFMTTVRKIFKLLFHVQAHMYYAHFNDFVNHGLNSHLNTVLMNFILYHQEFHLLDPKETAPLDDLLQAMGLIT